MNIKQKVGKRVDQLRIGKGLSVTYLAWDAGMDPSYLYEVIKGERNISMVRLNSLLIQLEISLHDFFSDPIFE